MNGPLTILLVFFVIFTVAEDLKLILLHNNDMHSRFEETSKNSGTCKESNKNKSCYGGFARTAHVIRQFRQKAQNEEIPDVLFLNAGDTYTGTSWYSVHKWKICADFVNVLEPDVLSLGNHEFDSGVAGLVPYLDAVKYPIVAANLNFTNEPSVRNIEKSHILTVKNTKIGVIGYLTPDTVQISQTNGVIFEDEVVAIKRESEILAKQGVHIIIALGHSGFLMDQKIAENVPLVDVVIGGHTNTFLWNGKAPDLEKPEDLYPKIITQKSGKKVPVVQAYAYTKYLGVLNTTFNEKGDLVNFTGQPILLDSSIPQDKDVLNLLEPYREKIAELNKLVVGRTKVLLDGDANVCRRYECNFGNLIADSLVQYVASLTSGKFWTQAPIGLINGGSIRNSIDPELAKGNITRGEILGVMPFDNRVITLQLTGEDLRKTMEQGVRSNGETSMGEFLQVSGLRVTVDTSRPVGSRIVTLKARCGECLIPRYLDVEPKKNYTIVTFSFLVEGGDGHTVLKDKSFNKRTEDLNDVDVFQWYLEKYSPVYPEVQGRIVVVNGTASGSTSNVKSANFFGLMAVGVVLTMLNSL